MNIVSLSLANVNFTLTSDVKITWQWKSALTVLFSTFFTEVFTVVVSFFSGRNNPQFIVEGNQNLKARMVEARANKWFGPPAQMPARLGYRGILVEDKITKFAGLLVGPKSANLQLELLRGVRLKEGDRKKIEDDINSGKIDFEKAPIFEVRGKRYAPRYNPREWNALEPIYRRQRCNNCYNYANINATDNFAQPGFGGGQAYTFNALGAPIPNPYTAANLRAAALRDGLFQLNPHPAPADPVPGAPINRSRHLVALVVKPGM